MIKTGGGVALGRALLNFIKIRLMRILKVKCLDKPGIISKISTVVYENGCNIIKLDEYVEPEQKYFFFRAEIEGSASGERLVEEIEGVLGSEAEVSLSVPSKKGVVILATREQHCLGDILLRSQGPLNIEIRAVIANHPDLETLTRRFDVPFHLISHENLGREAHAQRMAERIDKYAPEYILLAKYLRILPASFVERYPNQIINIHHSFLPAFIGANPYHQAFKRGVKIIGATSHCVTEGLDEGPIIEQDILHIDHSYNALELSALGKDVEQLVFSKAIKYVTEDRVFVHRNKTVVFK